jgi:hydrogenase maturation protein HypF
MHEFGITERLFQIALEQADLQDGERIRRLQITLDPDSGYVPDAICFYFEQLARGTPAEGATLDFDLTTEPRHIALNTLEIEEARVSVAGRHPTNGPEVVCRWRLTVNGVVQGVGFRPFVYNLARQLGLCGWVRNTAAGVEMELQGQEKELEHFLHHLHHDAPPLAHILAVDIESIPTLEDQPDELQIRTSHEDSGRTLISPDVATCPRCLSELFDPPDRRYHYPFTNCTHCGPRFTIIESLPYDRPRTTMAGFPLCPACVAEYHRPDDRRFHAQPVACPVCGPDIWYTEAQADCEPADETPIGEAALAAAVACLTEGGIVAMKGLGGFHLVCRADDDAAVRRLRQRKSRPYKPLAVMVRNLEEASRSCELGETEKALLLSPEAPIVLLRKRTDAGPHLAPAISPQNGYIGLMLPYTPLHHLLLQEVGLPLVMTSGNRSGEPLCIDNAEAAAHLVGICDGFLFHNRPIARRCDDSVLATAAFRDKTVSASVRRSRGLAPLPILLPESGTDAVPMVVAGADLKNVSAVVVDRQVFLSQHIGDLSHPAARREQAAAIESLERLFNVRPQAIVCDLHPDYASAHYARRRATTEGLPLIEVQHHHAHIAACLAENQYPGPVIGLSFDGTGYGADGCIWGGEVLLATLADFQRLYHLQYLPLPGGDAGARHLARIALAYLRSLLPEVDPGPLLPTLSSAEMSLIEQMLARQFNTPLTSSMGRLFDAVSALLGLCHQATYEAQAAIALEEAALRSAYDGPGYSFYLADGQIMLAPLFEQLLEHIRAGRPIPDIARAFHLTIAEIAVAAAKDAHNKYGTAGNGLKTVALSGGVWQNRLLLELTVPRLQKAGFEVLLQRAVPANDGGLAYGQAAVAAAWLAKKGNEPCA